MSNLVPVRLKDRVEDLRDSVLAILDRWLPTRRQPPAESAWDSGGWVPSWAAMPDAPVVDVAESDNEILVTAEMPGLDKKDFNVELRGDRLIIHGEKKAEREEKDRNYFYRECSYGSFSRAVALPCEVDTAKAEATYRRGVLRITLPKTAAAKAKRVKVRIN